MNRRQFAALLAGGVAPTGAARALGVPSEPRGSVDPNRPVRIAMLLYRGMTALDLVGPQMVLSSLWDGRLHLVAKAPGIVATDTGLSLVATSSFDDCPPELDLLFVPGGDGTPDQMRDAATLAFLADRGALASWVTSVCTGSLILGAAGLLRGYRATSHLCVRDAVLPLLGAVALDERVVFDRNRVTAAGISAGLDLALALAARLRGEEYASTSQLVAEYAPQPPFAAGTPAAAGPAITARANAILADLTAGCRAAAEHIARR